MFLFSSFFWNKKWRVHFLNILQNSPDGQVGDPARHVSVPFIFHHWRMQRRFRSHFFVYQRVLCCKRSSFYEPITRERVDVFRTHFVDFADQCFEVLLAVFWYTTFYRGEVVFQFVYSVVFQVTFLFVFQIQKFLVLLVTFIYTKEIWPLLKAVFSSEDQKLHFNPLSDFAASFAVMPSLTIREWFKFPTC